jgi:hypothetical protein
MRARVIRLLWIVFRFVVFAAIYCALILSWAAHEGGHGAMGIVAGGIITSAAAVVAWLGALIVSRLIAIPIARVALHVALVFALFIVISIGIFTGHDFLFTNSALLSIPFSAALDFVATLGAFAAIAALPDGFIGFWKDQRSI